MGVKEKDKSLLEIAIELLQKKRKPQKINAIVKEVMELKGLKMAPAKEAAPQFILDFMQSGYFVYCGDDCWDLKERQSTAVLDKDGGDYEDIYFDNEDVKKNELKDDFLEIEYENKAVVEEADDDEEEDDGDDLSHEFDNLDEEAASISEEEGETDDEMEGNDEINVDDIDEVLGEDTFEEEE